MNVREEITECCKRLRLSQNMVKSLDLIEKQDSEEFILELLNREIEYREETRKVRNLKNAGFYTLKTFDDFVFDNIRFPSGTNPEVLRTCDFIKEKKNLILFGNVGTGKTHMATAFGVEACRQGIKVRFFRTAALVNKLLDAKKGGTLQKFFKQLEKADLIICDEWGYVPLDRDGSRLLFQLVSDCYERQSIILTTNLEFSRWVTIFYDEQMTTAMIDRLVHHSHLLVFDGESWRMKNSLLRQ
jgi:DNA replication protein DnaC